MNAFRTILFALLFAGVARAESLVMLVDTGTEMPMADIHDGRLRGGIHHDLAQALARQMGRTLETVVLPRKRIASALEAGRADMVCLYLPEWLPSRFLWTQPVLPHAEVVLTALAAPAPHSLADLARQPIGTVHGFEYPALGARLGAGFVREDGPSDLANLRKMGAGRMRHVVTNRIFYAYQLRQGEKIQAHAPLLVKQYMVRCAVAPRGRVSLAEADAAIGHLLREGAVHRILAHYQ